jgi:hypothetical protein
MPIRGFVTRYSRVVRRGIAVVLTALVLGSLALPVDASAKSSTPVHVVNRSASDSPEVP